MPSRSGLRRTSSLLAALWCGAALAQHQRPVPDDSPGPLIGHAVRVHVIASDELEPDVLRALARDQVVLWLTTSSNTLRESTLDTLKQFQSSFVQLRPPLSRVDGRALQRVPLAGFWVPLDDGMSAALSRFRGSRPVAVEVAGPMDEAKRGLLLAQRPAFTRWTPPEALDLLQWSQFRSLPGKKAVVVRQGLLLPRDCASRDPAEPAAELHVATLLALSAGAFPCGPGARVEIAPDAEPWLLKSLIVRDPSVELVVRVGDDVRRVGKARALLELLGR